MIADLGLSKQLTVEVTSNSTVYGMPAYIEPQYYKNHHYVRDKRSDIYSLGVLLWEITSGRPPFSTIPRRYSVVYKVSIGLREQPMSDTPSDYVELYQNCWNDNPDSRPTIDEVIDTLEKFSLQLNNDNERNSKITENLEKLIINIK